MNKQMQDWYAEYALSHQNPTNIAIHFICVPLIYLSILAMIYSIPSAIISNTFRLSVPIIENWAFVACVFVVGFYLRLSSKTAIRMAVFSICCLLLVHFMARYVNILHAGILIFVLAWIGQFIGHKIEGKKPSFFKDLQFLLIGPAWVIHKMLR